MGDQSCLIRYGVMSHVGQFSTVPVRGTSLERGQRVVIQTDRGIELGEILIVLDGHSASPGEQPGDRTPAPNGDESSACRCNQLASRGSRGRCRRPGELSRPRRNCGRVAFHSASAFSATGTGRGI